MTPADRKPLRIWEFLELELFRDLGIPALVVSLVLLVSAMTLMGASVSELRSSYARTQQTNQALVEIAMMNTGILRVEMTVRGYALSGDTSYLTWQKMAKDGLNVRLATLDKLFGDSQEERAGIAALRRLLAAHMAYFDRLALLVKDDRPSAIAEIVDYSKKVKRRPIEDLLVDLRNGQTRRLGDQHREAETRVVSAYRYAIAISTLAALFGAVGFALLLLDRRGRRQVRGTYFRGS